MRHANHHRKGSAVLLLTLLAPTWCLAGTIPSPGSITFAPLDQQATSVPTLGGTMLLLLALLLAFIAFRSMRESHGGGTTHTAVICTLLAGALASSALGINLMRVAGAGNGGMVTVIEEDLSPLTFPLTGGKLNVFQNESRTDLVVQARTLPEPSEEECPDPGNAGTECTLNTILRDGTGCNVDCRNGAAVSDLRLKADVAHVGFASNGLPLYEFRYVGGAARYRGVMAQDVLMHTPGAVLTRSDGYLAVDYRMLGLSMTRVD